MDSPSTTSLMLQVHVPKSFAKVTEYSPASAIVTLLKVREVML